MNNSPKFLFIPVSSPEGIGEYMRSMTFADEIMRTWVNAEVKFILSRQAPYATQCPYETVLLDDSPTKQVSAVNQIITEFRPDIVIFDASGRKSQLSHAHKHGAKVIFLSQHKRKRSRGMKIGRALVTDCHWVVQPEFVIGSISKLDRVKLKLIGKPEPVNIGPVFTQPDNETLVELLAKYQLTANEYVIFNAGSGGHLVNGELAADIFAKVAHESYLLYGVHSVLVMGANYPNAMPEFEGVTVINQLNNKQFISLLSASKAAVLSGGDTLLQSIALKKLTLAVPVSKDQPSRIRACKSRGLILACETEVREMLVSYAKLLSLPQQQNLHSSMQANPKMNGLALGMADITRLLRLS